MKLRTKFSLVASFLIILIVTGVSIALFIAEEKILIRDMEKNLFNLVETFAQVCRDNILIDDELAILNCTKIIKKSQGVRYVLFTDNEGRILSPDFEKLPKYLLPDVQQEKGDKINRIKYTAEGKEIILDLGKTIRIEGKKAGAVHIGFAQKTLENIVTEAKRGMRNRIFAVALATLFWGILLTLILTRSLTGSIGRLSRGAEIIGQGHLDHQIEIKTKDELGELAKAFNEMAGQLKKLDEMKSSFISSVSHELKSPLYYIKNYIELFLSEQDKNLSEDHKAFFSIINSNIARLSKFIGDILDVAKIEAGVIRVKKEAIDLEHLIDEILGLMKMTIQEKKITIEVSIDQEARIVQADTEKLKHILTNLIDNSLKFTPAEGKIGIKACILEKINPRQPGSATGRYIKISITDTGIGIPKDQLNMIFNRFHQASQSKLGGRGGTGLGLSIVKGFVEIHHGQIWVETTFGKGSSFHFTIPIEENYEKKL